MKKINAGPARTAGHEFPERIKKAQKFYLALNKISGDMRSLITVYALAGVFIIAASARAGENLLRNGGFETSDPKTGFAAGWSKTAGAELSSDSFSGKRTAALAATNEGNNYEAVSQTVPAEEQCEYIVKCQLKTMGGGKGNCAYGCFDSAGKVIYPPSNWPVYWSPSHETPAWKLLVWKFTTPPGTTRINISFRNQGDSPGTVWFDEISLEEAAPMAGAAELPEEARLVFKDDFNSDKLADNWKIMGGNWEIKERALHGLGPDAVIVCTNRIGRNMRVEYTAWAEGAPCDLSALLAIDPADAVGAGYFFGFGSENNAMNKIMRRGKQLARTMMEGFSSGIVPGKKHRVTAQCNGDRLTLMIDGRMELEADDFESMDIVHDQFGFYIWNEGCIDDLKVYALPETRQGSLSAEVKPDVSEHIGFDTDKIGEAPLSMKIAGTNVMVTDEPTWIYLEDSEDFAQDPCARIKGPAILSKSFTPLESGIVEFDILAKAAGPPAQTDGRTTAGNVADLPANMPHVLTERSKNRPDEGIRASLYDEAGAEIFALIIDKQGTFWAETGKGTQKLLDTIEYRRRTIPARFGFEPGRWYTLRIHFDAQAGLVRSVAAVNLYTEIKEGDARAVIDQGDYHQIGAGLPFVKKRKKVVRFSLSTKGSGELLFDNLCVLGPVGRRRVDGKAIQHPLRTLMKLDFPARKDPFDVKLYSLRNLATRASFTNLPEEKISQYGQQNIFDLSWYAVRNDANKSAKFRAAGAERYNTLLTRQAYITENRLMLDRAAYYLKKSGQLTPDLAAKIKEALAAEQRTLEMLNAAYKAYAHAYLNRLDEEEIDELFIPAADALEDELALAQSLFDACFDLIPAKTLSNPEQAKIPCPLPVETNYPVWKNGQWMRDGKPVFVFHGTTGPCDFIEPLRMQPPLDRELCFHPNSLNEGEFIVGIPDRLYTLNHRCPRKKFYSFLWTGVHDCRKLTPRWWLEANQDDKDIFLANEDGTCPAVHYNESWLKNMFIIGLNFWNPKVKQYMEDYHGAIASWLKTNAPDRTLFITLGAEARNSVPAASMSVGGSQETGHNASTVEAFRDFLIKEYKTIEALNKTWGANYASFSEIVPPKRSSPPSGVKYEFQRFRHQGYKDWIMLCRSAIQEHLPEVPVQHDFQEFMGGQYVGSFDMPAYFEMCDIVAYHNYNHAPLKASDRWLDSLRKVYGNALGNSEWHAAMCCPEMFDEDVYKNSGLAQAFHRMMWGQGMSSIWDLRQEYNWVYSQCFADPRFGYILLRYFSAYASLMYDRAGRLGTAALEAPSVQPDIGILEVTSSYYQGIGGVRLGMEKLALALEKEGFNYGIFYEKLLLEGKQSLAGIQTLLVPGGICMPPQLARMLAGWVKEGGMFIAYGPPEYFDQYGRPAGGFMREAFGKKTPWLHKSFNDWTPAHKNAIKALKSWGGINLYKAAYGRGKMYLFNSVTAYDDMMRCSLELVRDATVRSFYCRNNRLDLVMREKGNRQYLYALNSSLKEIQEDEIIVRGGWNVEDLGLPRAMRLPVKRENGTTVFFLRLAPAEGTLLGLEKINKR